MTVLGWRDITILLLVTLLVAGRAVGRTWATGPTMIIAPFLMTLLGQSLFFPSWPFGFRAALVVLCSFGSFVAGYVVIHGVRNAVPPSERRWEFEIRERGRHWANGVSWILALSTWALAIVAIRLRAQEGLELAPDIALKEEMAVAMRGSAVGALMRAAQLVANCAPLCLTWYAVARGHWARRKLAVCVLGMVTVAVVTTARQGVLLSGVSIACVAITATSSEFRSLLSRRVLQIVGGVVGLIGGTLLVLVVRYEAFGRIGGWIFERFAMGLFGGGSGFSMWLEQSMPLVGAFEGRSILGAMELIGAAERTIGAYEHVTLIRTDLGISTNIFSGLRFLGEDFGIVGTIAILGILGLLSGFLQRRFEANGDVGSGYLLSVLYTTYAWLPITLLSYYNFWILLVVATPVIVLVLRRRRVSTAL